MCGFIAQLVEHRTGIAEVTGSNPVEALIFFRLLLSSCLNWKIHCEDHSSLSSMTAVQIYELFHICLDKINDVAFSASQTLALGRPESSEIGKSHKNSVHAVNSRPLLFRYCIPLKHCLSIMQIYSATPRGSRPTLTLF